MVTEVVYKLIIMVVFVNFTKTWNHHQCHNYFFGGKYATVNTPIKTYLACNKITDGTILSQLDLHRWLKHWDYPLGIDPIVFSPRLVVFKSGASLQYL